MVPGVPLTRGARVPPNHHKISVRRIPDDQEIRSIPTSVLLPYLAFSPDGQYLVALLEHQRTLQVWRLADGVRVFREWPRFCQTYTFSADGRHLVIGQFDCVIFYDLATGLEDKRWQLTAAPNALAFHPNGRKLAVGYVSSAGVSVHDVADGKRLTYLPTGAIFDQVVAWDPDGAHLAVTGSDPRIQMWNVAAQRKVAILDGHLRQRTTTLTFHPDRDLLASYGGDGVLVLWQPFSGRELMRMPAVAAPHFSADGRWLGVAWDGAQADLLEVTPSREYRTLVSSAGADRGGYGCADISPDGRLLVVGMDDGARLWDLRRGQEIAALPAGTCFAFFETRAAADGGRAARAPLLGGVLTCGRDGLQRWPLASPTPDGTQRRLGPPERLSELPHAAFARGADGATCVAATSGDGRHRNHILDLQQGTVRRALGGHDRGEVRALSRDGNWAASCGWHSPYVRLWNLQTGEARELATGKHTEVYFTPDSGALITAGDDGFTFWDVETVQVTRRLRRHTAQWPGWVAFSPDGRLMALELTPGVLHLQELSTGRTIARLEDPHGDRASWQGFTPDGTQLVVVSKNSSVVHIWDLRLIRSRLKALGLDWDWPEFAPAAAAAPAKKLTIERPLLVR